MIPRPPGSALFPYTTLFRSSGGTANGGVNLDVLANTLTFNVTPVNDAPSGSDATIVMAEDAQQAVSATAVRLTDVEGDSLLPLLVTAVPAQGSLTLNGQAVT